MHKKLSRIRLLFAWIVAAICLVALVCSFGLVGRKTKLASAASSQTTFEMIGASVRRYEPDGIRFVAKIESKEFSSYGATKHYGMIVVPEDLADDALTVSCVEDKVVASDADALVIAGGDLWSEALRAKYGIADSYEVFSCALLAEQPDEGEAVRFPKEFYNRPLTAVAYIVLENGDIVYTQKMTRSISYVALLESLSDAYEESVYIDRIVDELSVDFAVNGGNALSDKSVAYLPDLKLGGMPATAHKGVSVTYVSADESIAKVVDGSIKAVANGSTTITATVSVGGTATFTATAKVDVNILTGTVTTSTNLAGAGTVSGAGTYSYGDTVTMTATTNTGYTFDGWYVAGEKVSSDATYTFTMKGNKAVEARWTLNTYTISATSESATKGTVTGGGTYEHFSTATLKATRKTGYKFSGWYEGSTRVSTSATYSFEVTGARTLVAKWATLNYTVTFDSNGGSAVDSQTVQEGKAATKPADPTRKGYTFAGWDYNFTDAITGDKTVTASWTLDSYTISYTLNGGSVATANPTSYNVTTATFTLNNPTKKGYTFAGWTGSNGTTASTSVSVAKGSTGNKSYTANWTANTYTVKYNANGGSGTMSSVTHTYDTAKALTANAFTRTGYTFAGWNTKTDGTGTSYTNQQSVSNLTATNGGSVTLYAKWTANTYTVKYNANGGSGTMSNSSRTYGDGAALRTNTFTRTGYTFAGWNTKTDGTGTSFAAGSTANVTSGNGNTVTLYAQWKANTYTVKYYGNGSTSGALADSSRTYDDGAALRTNAYKRTGYTFAGWNTKADGTGTSFAAGSTANVTSNNGVTINLYAQWTIVTYTISYTLNDGKVSTANPTSYNVTTATFTLNNPTKTGYTFTGWTGSNGTTAQTAVSIAKGSTGNKSYTANWKINTYTVKFSVDGAIKETKTVNYNSTVSAATSPTKTGYTFKHWSTTSGSDTAFSFTTKITGNITLYAVWTANKYTITATAGTVGGSVSGGGSKAYDSSVTLKATANSGYTFVGWYNSKGEKVSSSASYSFTCKGAAAYTAKWKVTPVSDSYKNTNGYNYFYYPQLGTEVMPIGAWSSPPPARQVYTNGVLTNYSTNQATVANYQVLKASGINAIYGLYDDYWSYNVPDAKPDGTHWKEMTTSLDCAEATGMVYIVKDGGAYNALSKLGAGAWERLEAYMSHPAYGGTLFVDEPGYEQFSAIGSAVSQWRKNEVYGESKLALVNNLPIYSTQAQLYYGIQASNPNGSAPTNYTGANFENWVKAYIQTVKPQVYSFDFYPYFGYGNTMHSGYFENLSVVRKVCAENNVPFWTFNQAGSAFGNTRDLSYAETAMQVNLSLAYGAKGIQWFNYWQPLEFSADAEDINGLIDHYGNKTKYYDYVQKINKQIAAVDHVLMKSKSTGIIPIGEAMYGAIPSRDILSKYGAVTGVTGSGSAIVGCFDYRDQGYAYYVASTDANADAVVTLTLNGTYAVEKIQDGAACWATGSKITVHVPAGEGVLVRVPKTTASETMRTLTLSNTDTTAGTVYGAGSYGSGKTITIAAVAKPGYEFVGWWSGNSLFTTLPVYSFTTTSNMTLTANWRKNDAPLTLNTCETAGTWVSAEPTGSPNLSVTTSTSYVTQGSKSVKISGLASGLFYLRLGEKCMTLSELKSAYKVISFNIYSTNTADQALWFGNWGAFTGNYVKPGYNLIKINTADLTSDYYSAGILKLTLPPTNASSPTTFYVDNIVALKGTTLVNDCESTDYIQSSNAQLSTLNVYQGSHSLQVSHGAGWWSINLRVGAANCSLANFQAMYSKITFNVYSDYPDVNGNPANTMFLGNGEAHIATLKQGNNVVTVDTSQLTATTLVTDAWGTYINFFVGGASTLRIDNVVATLK